MLSKILLVFCQLLNIKRVPAIFMFDNSDLNSDLSCNLFNVLSKILLVFCQLLYIKGKPTSDWISEIAPQLLWIYHLQRQSKLINNAKAFFSKNSDTVIFVLSFFQQILQDMYTMLYVNSIYVLILLFWFVIYSTNQAIS